MWLMTVCAWCDDQLSAVVYMTLHFLLASARLFRWLIDTPHIELIVHLYVQNHRNVDIMWANHCNVTIPTDYS